jgi:WD40 repeat protein
VWDAVTGQEQVVLVGHAADVASAVFSQDGRRVLTESLDDETIVRVWDAESGRELAALAKWSDRICFNTFSADGKRIAQSDIFQWAVIWSRRRPEYWWGIAWLPEFWVSVLSGGALLVVAVRHLLRRGTADDGSRVPSTAESANHGATPKA